MDFKIGDIVIYDSVQGVVIGFSERAKNPTPLVAFKRKDFGGWHHDSLNGRELAFVNNAKIDMKKHSYWYCGKSSLNKLEKS